MVLHLALLVGRLIPGSLPVAKRQRDEDHNPCQHDDDEDRVVPRATGGQGLRGAALPELVVEHKAKVEQVCQEEEEPVAAVECPKQQPLHRKRRLRTNELEHSDQHQEHAHHVECRGDVEEGQIGLQGGGVSGGGGVGRDEEALVGPRGDMLRRLQCQLGHEACQNE